MDASEKKSRYDAACAAVAKDGHASIRLDRTASLQPAIGQSAQIVHIATGARGGVRQSAAARDSLRRRAATCDSLRQRAAF
jgi:hypothetical protein